MNFNYGIALSTERQLLELPDLPEAGHLELNCQLLDQGGISLPHNWRERILRCSGRSEGSTFSALIEAGFSMRQDFFRLFTRRCEAFSVLGGSELSFAPEWEKIFSDRVYANKFREILCCCSGIMERRRLTPVIEVRIPGAAADRLSELLLFIHSLLYPVRILVDLHPHEPGALELFEAYSGKLRCDCSRIRISFNSDDGNYLSGKLLDRIRSFILPVGKEIPEICFYPGKRADRMIFAALGSVMR